MFSPQTRRQELTLDLRHSSQALLRPFFAEPGAGVGVIPFIVMPSDSGGCELIRAIAADARSVFDEISMALSSEVDVA